MVDITIVNGVYKPTYNYGAPPCRYSCPGLQNNKNNILEFGDTTVSYDSQNGRNHGNITSCKMVDLLFLMGKYDWEAFLASG
jgi:hypothetical protein